jgi:hypothetical protein
VGKISGIQSGISGEYFVAAELSRRGYICSITLKNTKGIDVLVSNEQSKKLVGAQVKTNNSSRKAWLLNKNAESLSEDNFVYVFVNLNGLEQLPDFYIVPSMFVGKCSALPSVKNNHSAASCDFLIRRGYGCNSELAPAY